MDLIKGNERLDDLQFNDLMIIQDPEQYCFSSDAVDLANFVKCGTKDSVVDLCSGSGVIGILVHCKNNAKQTTLVELQSKLADMSRRTIEYNKLSNIEVINKPLQNISDSIGSSFDVVVCNPPYKMSCGALLNQKQEIAICRHEITVTLEEIIKEASKLLKYGGKFYIVNKEERLTDIFCLMRKYNIEPKRLKIKHSNKFANIVLCEGKKGGKSGLTICK